MGKHMKLPRQSEKKKWAGDRPNGKPTFKEAGGKPTFKEAGGGCPRDFSWTLKAKQYGDILSLHDRKVLLSLIFVCWNHLYLFCSIPQPKETNSAYTITLQTLLKDFISALWRPTDNPSKFEDKLMWLNSAFPSWLKHSLFLYSSPYSPYNDNLQPSSLVTLSWAPQFVNLSTSIASHPLAEF